MLPFSVRVDLGAMAIKGYSILRIPQGSNITRISSSDSLVPYRGCSLAWSYPPGEMQPVYSTAAVNWAVVLIDDWFGLVSLFNGISTLFRLFNAKSILLEEQ